MVLAGGAAMLLLAALVAWPPGWGGGATAAPLARVRAWRDGHKPHCDCDGQFVDDVEGDWYWMRCPDQEKRVVVSHYNRYCVRCHGVDGRGVWDIPDVPNFANPRWQATRSDRQLACSILEGRGAVMPPFRGALTLEESWALARYIRTLVPGTESPRPDTDKPEKPAAPEKIPTPPKERPENVGYYYPPRR
jgi:cytochrome c553